MKYTPLSIDVNPRPDVFAARVNSLFATMAVLSDRRNARGLHNRRDKTAREDHCRLTRQGARAMSVLTVWCWGSCAVVGLTIYPTHAGTMQRISMRQRLSSYILHLRTDFATAVVLRIEHLDKFSGLL